MRIALATCQSLSDLFPSDRLLADALERSGVEAIPWIWDEEMPAGVEAVVVRTIWDYWHKVERFRSWLEKLDELGLPVINPLSTLQWNLDKRYLFELAEEGVTIPRTSWLEETRPLTSLHDELSSDVLVIKPAISAGGDDTFKVDRRDESDAQQRVDALVTKGPLLVQEFIEEVDDGELSLLFFGGEYSHTIIKRAAPGEFRIHIEYGGTVDAIEPPAELIEQARHVMAQLPRPPAYARVDGLVRGSELVLMELELIEPELFFDYREGSAERFAEVIARQLVPL